MVNQEHGEVAGEEGHNLLSHYLLYVLFFGLVYILYININTNFLFLFWFFFSLCGGLPVCKKRHCIILLCKRSLSIIYIYYHFSLFLFVFPSFSGYVTLYRESRDLSHHDETFVLFVRLAFFFLFLL